MFHASCRVFNSIQSSEFVDGNPAYDAEDYSRFRS